MRREPHPRRAVLAGVVPQLRAHHPLANQWRRGGVLALCRSHPSRARRYEGRVTRPLHLPWQADLVVRASRELSDIEKLVWLEDRGLDQGAMGCFAGAGVIADRLGRSRDTIERARRELVRLGLHETRLQPGRRTASWYARLPATAVPTVPSDVPDRDTWRPDPDLVRRLMAQLDAAVRTVRGPRLPENGGSSTATSDKGMAAATPPLRRRLAAAPHPTGGTGAASTGGSATGGMAAPLPPRSTMLARESALSSSGESERVANATTAEPKHNPAASQDGSQTTYRCDRCGRPLPISTSGRLRPCGACSGNAS